MKNEVEMKLIIKTTTQAITLKRRTIKINFTKKIVRFRFFFIMNYK